MLILLDCAERFSIWRQKSNVEIESGNSMRKNAVRCFGFEKNIVAHRHVPDSSRRAVATTPAAALPRALERSGAGV
jgi:hypothetical protein